MMTYFSVRPNNFIQINLSVFITVRQNIGKNEIRRRFGSLVGAGRTVNTIHRQARKSIGVNSLPCIFVGYPKKQIGMFQESIV